MSGEWGAVRNGSAAAAVNIDHERRLIHLEVGERDVVARLSRLEGHELEARRALASLKTEVGILKGLYPRLRERLDRLDTEQRRVIIGAACLLAGIVGQIVMSKLGLPL